MSKRFPEQRNGSAQRRADAHQVPASAHGEAVQPEIRAQSADEAVFLDDETVFDEAFVEAATMREPSALSRFALAQTPAEAPGRLPWGGGDPPLPYWSVRPARRFAAIRATAVAAATCAMGSIALLIILLR
jgi:hypothetical protein